jgi:Ran GTPase-activating protein (RanGAP) involved in mRNA processing and transport
MMYNSIGNEGVAAIAKALRANLHVTVLGLGVNGITHEGAKHLSKLLMVNSTLKQLFLFQVVFHTFVL